MKDWRGGDIDVVVVGVQIQQRSEDVFWSGDVFGWF